MAPILFVWANYYELIILYVKKDVKDHRKQFMVAETLEENSKVPKIVKMIPSGQREGREK